jgi:hypothetical protein
MAVFTQHDPTPRNGHFAFRLPRFALVLPLLAVLTLAAAACDTSDPTPAPIGPGAAVPTATPAPTETAVSVTGSGAELYKQAHDAMLALKSYHFVSDTDLGHGATQHVDGDWGSPNRLRMTLVNKGTGQDGTQYIVRIGKEQWTRPTESAAWTAVQNAPAVSVGPDQAAGILATAQSVEKTDDTTLNGTPAYHLTFQLGANPNEGIGSGSGELWIAQDTHYIVQMKLLFTTGVKGARGEANSTLVLSKFNELDPNTIAHP